MIVARRDAWKERERSGEVVATTRHDAEHVIVKCTGGCKGLFVVPFTEEQEHRVNEGALIQRVTPRLNADMRELLISGTCPACREAMFGDEE